MFILQSTCSPVVVNKQIKMLYYCCLLFLEQWVTEVWYCNIPVVAMHDVCHEYKMVTRLKHCVSHNWSRNSYYPTFCQCTFCMTEMRFIYILRKVWRCIFCMSEIWFTCALRKAWRYHRGHQKPRIEKGNKTQWPAEKEQKDKLRSTKQYAIRGRSRISS